MITGRMANIARMPLLALALLSWLGAPSPAAERAQLVDEFIQRTGVARQIQVIPIRVSWKFDYIRRNGAIPSAVRKIMVEVLRAEFAADPLLALCRKSLLTRTEDDANLAAVLDLVNNPLYAHLRQLRLGLPAEPEDAVSAYWDEFKKMPHHEIRSEIVDQLMKAERGLASKGNMEAVMSLISPRATNAARPEAAFPTDAQLSDEAQARFAEWKKEIAASLEKELVYVYREATDTELEEFTELMASPAGQDYTRYLERCLLDTVYKASRQMEQKIRDRVLP